MSLESVVPDESLLTVWCNSLQLRLMASLRLSITEDRFPQFVREFMEETYPDGKYPDWAVEALASVNISL